MTNRLAVLLACIIASEAVRYGDYSGAQMPHFGIAYENKESASLTDEYPDRSPDAAATFDYKYEEEPKNKIEISDQEDEETWHKSEKRLKPADDKDDVYSEEQHVPRFKSNRRFLKHRPRTKDLYKENKRKSVEYDYTRNDDNHELDNNRYINKHLSRDDNRLDLENFDFRYTTRRLARRKPRDRTLIRERLHKHNIQDDEFGLKVKETNEDSSEIDLRGNPQTALERTRSPYLDLEKIKNHNYNEYEDTIRFNTIRNKLPGLLRQTKASASSIEMTPSTRLLQDITYRRANIQEKFAESNSVTEATLSVTTSENLVTSTFQLKESIDVKEISSPLTTSEISLAEKSRLSIMKKAQKKEGLQNVTRTTKPPVLMQVTNSMQTVVMIESPNRDLSLRAREVFDDSPEKINRAKRLMRHKLVSGARSIHDLIDNWDEMVCDYIDTALLESDASLHVQVDLNIILLSAIYLLISNRLA